MCVCMCVYARAFVCVYVCVVCARVYVCAYACVNAYICGCVCVHVRALCVCVSVCVCFLCMNARVNLTQFDDFVPCIIRIFEGHTEFG